MQAERKFLPYINEYKFFLAMVVLIGHFYNYIGGRTIYGIRLIGGAGAKAVDAFFLISGFLLFYSLYYKNDNSFKRVKDWLSFYKLKFKRIYPPYFIAITIAIFTQPLFSSIHRDTMLTLTGDTISAFNSQVVLLNLPTFTDIFLHLTMLHNLTPQYNSTILGPVWYVSAEWIFLLLSPLFWILLTNKKSKRLKHVGVFFVLFIELLGLWISHNNDMLQNVIRNLPVFVSGMFIAKYYIENSYKKLFGFILNTFLYLLLLDPTQNWLSCIFILGFLFLLSKKVKCILEGIFKFINLKRLSMYTYQIYLFHMLAIPLAFGVSLHFFNLEGTWLCLTSALLTILFLIVLIYIEVKFEKVVQKNAKKSKNQNTSSA